MTESYAVLIIGGVTVVISFTFHYFHSAYFNASVLAALTSTVVYQFLSYLEAGYLDPLFIVGLITGTLIALAISLIVGLPFLIYRRQQKNPPSAQ